MNLRKSFARSIALGLALNIAAVSPVLAQRIRQDSNGRIIPDPGKIGMSPEQQIQLGRQASAEVEKQMPVLPANSPVTLYVQRLGQKLTASAPGYKWPYTFKVVNQKDINAFALPGGPIYVNLGTIQAADESELAGVMAHEISHVVMQHSAREAGKQQGIQMLGALGSILAGAVLGNGAAGQLAQMGIQVGAAGVVTRYSRAAETEADELGTQIMYDAGFNPYAMVEFFQKLEQESGSGGPQFLSDHPNPGNRAQNVAQIVSRFPKKSYARSDSPEFVSMKRVAMGMKPLTAQQIAQQQKQQGGGVHGGVNSSIAPSNNFRQLNQGNFALDYPDNWDVFGDQSSGIIIAPRAGVGQNAIAYGVSINMAQANRGNGLSLDDLTSQAIQSFQRSNQDLKPVGGPKRIKVNGRDGRSVDLLATSPLQTKNGGSVRERDWLVTVQSSNNAAVVMVFTAPEPDFNQLRPTFENMLRSLQFR